MCMVIGSAYQAEQDAQINSPLHWYWSANWESRAAQDSNDQSWVEELEAQFHNSSETFSNGLNAIKTLNAGLTPFSISSNGPASNEAANLYEGYDYAYKIIDRDVLSHKQKCEALHDEVGELGSEARKVEHCRGDAEAASDLAAMVGFPVL